MDIELIIPYKGKEIDKPFKLNGEYQERVLKWYGQESSLVSGPFTRVEFVEPDLGSRQKVTKQLLRHGWKPTIFTDKGSPKLTIKGEPVDSLMKIEGNVGKSIARWYTYGHRASQIRGWIRDIRPDGRLTAGADTCGTNTCRFRHRTVVNCPKASKKVIFGYQMRELFTVPSDSIMCGHDASGLEARVQAHYTTPYDNGEYAKEILEGDIHTKNAKIFEVDRDTAKNGYYASIYGAQPPKLAAVLGCKQRKAKKLFDAFWEGNYALGKLREDVMRMAENKGFVPGLDGRKIYIRSSHSALNALFQSAGAIVMKYAMVILDYWASKEDLTYKKLIDSHDESQAELPRDEVILLEADTEDEALSLHKPDQIWSVPSLIDDKWITGYSRYGELAVKSIRRAGEYLKLRVPLDAEYKLGPHWACCH